MNEKNEIETFLALETKVWEALRAGEHEADRRLLSEDFLGVYPTGFAGRGDHEGQLDGGATVESYALAEARLDRIAPDAALLSYLAIYRRPGGDEERMYVSSLWRLRDGAWVNTFSQDTPVGPAVV